MKILFALSALAGSVVLSLPPSAAPQDPQEMATALQGAQKYMQPGVHHQVLKRFLGEWDVEIRFTMGGRSTPAEKGKAVFSWLVEGRWLQSTMTGTMLGRPIEAHSWLGYDNFKQSYVSTRVTSMDTAMARAEGDMTPDGKALITYGTIDEYLTGEHDKMVKYVWRFVGDDEIRLEVHDLPIGEEQTQVVGFTYRRTR